MKALLILFGLFFILIGPVKALGEEKPGCVRTSDVVYGRKHGVALTMDVITPENPNGLGVVFVVSGGWVSDYEMINVEFLKGIWRRGYTVFAVVHGSQPKYTIPEIIEDLHRSVRFIRYHAKDYGIDPDRIAIAGGSAGGHLSLIIATSGGAGNAEAPDPVDRESSKVQAVACFFPPTDFLNYGEEGRDLNVALEEELAPFKAPFDFIELEKKTGRLIHIVDPERRLEIAKNISPITHVSEDDPPTFIFHGDKDPLVPIQQSLRMKEALEAAGVEVKLVIREGQGHGWEGWLEDMEHFSDWFDKHLKKDD